MENFREKSDFCISCTRVQWKLPIGLICLLLQIAHVLSLLALEGHPLLYRCHAAGNSKPTLPQNDEVKVLSSELSEMADQA